MTSKNLFFTVSLLIMASSAHAVVVDNMLDVVRWQYENPVKVSAKHRLSDRAAAPIKEYTRANGPVFIKTAFAEKLDSRCATIAVTYFIENTLTISGKRVPYTQTVPVPYCRDGGFYKGLMKRPETTGHFAEDESRAAVHDVLGGKK